MVSFSSMVAIILCFSLSIHAHASIEFYCYLNLPYFYTSLLPFPELLPLFALILPFILVTYSIATIIYICCMSILLASFFVHFYGFFSHFPSNFVILKAINLFSSEVLSSFCPFPWIFSVPRSFIWACSLFDYSAPTFIRFDYSAIWFYH